MTNGNPIFEFSNGSHSVPILDEIEGEELENGSLMNGDDTEDQESQDDDQNNDDTVGETNDESDVVYDTDSNGDDNNDDDADGNVLMNVDAENVVHTKAKNGEKRRKTIAVPRRYKDTNKNKDGSYSCLVE